MKIEIIDLKKRYKEERTDLLKIIDSVLSKGHLVMTEEVKEFEQKVCEYTGSKYCVSLNSGTDALMMALWASGVKKGDEVITTPKTFIATIGAIVHVGAKPILVDVDEDLNMNADLIEKKITNKTKAIMPVHWTGRMCNMQKIKMISKKYGIDIIEDAAQGMGSYYKKKHAGTFSKVAAFSCHPLKNLNALGDSGFVITDDQSIYQKILLNKNHGLVARDEINSFGLNSRLDSINAKVLTYRLKKLKNLIKKRKKNINLYKKYIKTSKLSIISENSDSVSSHVIFNVLCENRDELKNYLEKNSIQSLIYYGTPVHLHKPMKKFGYKKGDFPVAENLCKKILALPHNQYIKEKEIEYISNKINEFYKKNES
mgnify:CR=1 FL=1